VAVNAVADAQGGLAVAANGEVLATLPLPIAGLMSDQEAGAVADGLRAVEEAAHQLGCQLPAPFMTLSFVPLAGLPVAGVSELGLLDASTRQPLELFTG
jgi:adenine deaminase